MGLQRSSCISAYSFLMGAIVLSTAQADVSKESLTITDVLENIIITKYFDSDKCIVHIVDEPAQQLSTINNLSHPSIIRISSFDVCDDPSLSDKIVFAIDSCCFSFILRVSKPVCVIKAWGKAQLSYEIDTFQRKSPKMFVTVFPVNDSIGDVDEFLSSPETELSSSIVVAVLGGGDPDWPVTLYTNNFYEPVSSAGRQPAIFLDRWNQEKGFQLGTDLYADKILDLQGKEIKVAVVDSLPYSQLRPFIGQEASMMTEFCLSRNCTIKGINDEWFWGEIFENGTGNGLVGMVFDGRADFGIAGVYLWASVFKHVGFSETYLQSGVTLLVPKPEKVGGWLIPFLPFSPQMWISYLLSVIATGISMHLITKATIKYTRFAEAVEKRGMFLTEVDTTFRALGLSVLQQPSTPLVPHTPIRHLFTSFEILYLVFCTVYAAELASVLTAPIYSKPIDSLEMFAGSGMTWLGEHNGWVYSLLTVETPIIKTIVNNFKLVTFEEMDELAITGKYGLIIEKLAGGNYAERQYLTEKIVSQSHVMAEYLYDSHVTTIMSKASPYFEHFNQLIRRLLENGLLLRWEEEASRLYMSYRLQSALHSARKINTEDEVRPLTFSDCLGMLLLYLAGIFISTAVFIGEVWTNKKKREREARFN
uniref:Ionotropic receptor 41a.3 n=1 Tax=Apolygus lucorum TaxID=248454 RepID=A0A7S5FGU8_APOLU|nr:ionotropic receptor 41a.3 [Apolygus lucorum]